jgi:hypothetical protein
MVRHPLQIRLGDLAIFLWLGVDQLRRVVKHCVMARSWRKRVLYSCWARWRRIAWPIPNPPRFILQPRNLFADEFLNRARSTPGRAVIDNQKILGRAASGPAETLTASSFL